MSCIMTSSKTGSMSGKLESCMSNTVRPSGLTHGNSMSTTQNF
ncbi:hypothetical protein LHYA1_G004635, partial [Lachnellula hyalina]